MAFIDRKNKISRIGFGTGSSLMGLFAVSMALFFYSGAWGASPGGDSDTIQHETGIVSFNQRFIEGLYTKFDVDNTDLVFDLVFSRLSDTVTVYPTENYYYFSVNIQGKTIWGNLRLDAVDRDRGIIHFGYFEYDENGRHQDREGHEKAYSRKDGVLVERVERFLYSVTYRGRTVMFRLNDIGIDPPKKSKLRKDEVFVGPLFDESGLKFFLIFNQTEKHFLYVLNEEEFTPESFGTAAENVVIGRRTGFAFYEDQPNRRKILIAVNGKHTDRNHYYDGPFDQLPDNYVPQIKLKKYLEIAYPFLKGRIDQYGGFLDQEGARALINPYTVYYEEDELGFVAYCESLELPAQEFYSCITPDAYQVEEP